MRTIINFMRQLGENNNKPWFDAHKADYLEMKSHLEVLAKEFIHGVGLFDERCKGLEVKDCIYRIYRDVRFSPDKRPYKHWCGVYVCPHGKKSGMAGYYFHVEPLTETYFLCSGLYNPSKEVLQSVREQITLDPQGFHNSMKDCRDFEPSWNNALKRLPKGYEEGMEHEEYLRLRDYAIMKPMTEQAMLAEGFMGQALQDLRRTFAYNELLNRCFEYAYDRER